MQLILPKYMAKILYKSQQFVSREFSICLNKCRSSGHCVNALTRTFPRQVCNNDQSVSMCHVYRDGARNKLISARAFLGFQNCKNFCSGPADFWDDSSDSDDEDKKDPEKAVDKLLQDADHNVYAGQFFGFPGSGHLLYVIQPVPKRAPVEERDVLTTPQLQLEEAIALVHSVPNWHVAHSEILSVHRIKSKLIFGSGQLQKLSQSIRRAAGISAVFIAVDQLTRLQIASLQKVWQLPIFDRTTVVLQIFREHARSKEAKLQVALAELPYIRCRMDEVDYGETQTSSARFAQKTGDLFINTRFMILEKRERKLKQALEALKNQRSLIRNRRIKRHIPTIAVIGYTNSGKTTLIKALTGDKALEPRDQLFATLDVTAHAGYLPNTMLAVFLDTVGFMSNLPRSLSTAFAATLEDAMTADLIVHVRDISNPNHLSQRQEVINSVRDMLPSLQFQSMVEVCNKVDRVSMEEVRKNEDAFYISSHTGQGIDMLRQEIQNQLLRNTGHLQKKIRVPMGGEHMRWLQKEATITGTETDKDTESLILHVVIRQEDYARFVARFGGARPTKQRNRYE